MFNCRILLDSISTVGKRITTFEIVIPRFLLAELNTHRVLARNTSSTRAIPTSKLISQVWNNPFIPTIWGKNQSGMQSKENLKGWKLTLVSNTWRLASKFACVFAYLMMRLGLHKQLCGRILEPWMWCTVIVTATEWDNFFALRTHPDAQPEFQAIAKRMKEEYDLHTQSLTNECSATWTPPLVQKLKVGEWHLPLVTNVDYDYLVKEGWSLIDIIKICVGRCCRVSYLTHLGVRDPKKDIELHDKLIKDGHYSPTEQCAQASNRPTKRSGPFRGWNQYRKTLPNEDDFSKINKNE